MSLLQRFIKNIEEQSLFQKNDYLLLAVSGGADSVALCELCFQAGLVFAPERLAGTSAARWRALTFTLVCLGAKSTFERAASM